MDELTAIGDHLEANGHNVISHQWRHWETPSIAWNVPVEVKLVQQKVAELESFAIVAKSLGTFVAINLLPEVQDRVERVILLGIPYHDLVAEERSLYVPNFNNCPGAITVLQNEFDDHGSYAEIEQLIGDSKAKLICEAGKDNHRYNYPEKVLELLML